MSEPSGTDRPGRPEPGPPGPGAFGTAPRDGDSGTFADAAAPSDRSGRWRLEDWPLRTKLVAVLLVPLVLAGVLGGLRVLSSAQDAGELDAVVGQVEAGRQVAVLVEELQRERALAVTFVAGDRRGPLEGLRTQAGAVDAAAAAFTAVPRERFGPAAGDVYDSAVVRVAGLAPLRQAVTQTAYPADRAAVAYTAVVDVLLALQSSALRGSDGALLRQAGDALLVADVKEQVQRQRATLLAVLLSGVATAPQQVAALSADAQLATRRAEFATSATPEARALFAATVAGDEVDDRERLEQRLLSALSVAAPPPGDVAAEWNRVSGRTAELVRDVEIALLADLVDDGSQLAAQARGAAVRDGVLVGLLVLLAMLLLVLVARSLVRPLRTLRAAAFDVAHRRLPEAVERMHTIEGVEPTLVVEPIGIHTREEIGEVARAFDAVHGEAVRLAAQQALLRNNINDIFVNLSQRSQGLVKRQLVLIDDLERGEQDPDHLENLFQLDHLATRMRRNNENLLVLAGAADLRARRKRPVPARDVLRAAVSEIEEYRRVTVRRAPGIAVAGPVVNDLVHLVAELLDNATSFSPPDSEVVLRAATGAGGTLVVEIVDTGVGIAPADLAALNRQLADPPVVDLAVARRMGLFVVGRLARRHNITVVLRPAPEGTGVHAAVEVPAVYLQSGATPGADGGLDVPTQVLPAVGRTPAEPAAAPPEPPAPRSAPEARPAPPPPAPALPAPRRDGPVPADDPLSGPWLPAPVEPDERELPIYGEMRSAWFRQRRFASALGTEWAPQGPGVLHPGVPQGPDPTSRAGLPVRRPGSTGPTPAATPADHHPAPDVRPADPAGRPAEDAVTAAPDPDAPEVEWGEMDAGWAAARSAADPRPDTTTSAGLPKRKPRSQLVPGSITPGAGPSAVRPPTRSPEVVRGRLSGYQRGLREGREARAAEIERRDADGRGS